MNESGASVMDAKVEHWVHPDRLSAPAGAASRTPVRVLVVDRPGWVYHGSAAISNAGGEIEIVGRALDPKDAARLAIETRPEVLVISLPSDTAQAIETLRDLRSALPEPRMIAFSSGATGAFIRAAFEAGVSALLYKDDDSEMLAHVVRSVRDGGRFYSSVWQNVLLAESESKQEEFDRGLLTAREWEVLALIAEGYNSRESGVRLEVAITTIHAHRANIMKKLGIHKAAGLSKWYWQHCD